MEEEKFYKIIEKKIQGLASAEEEVFLDEFEKKMLEKNKVSVYSNNLNRNKIGQEIFSNVKNHVKVKKAKTRYAYYSVAASILIMLSIGLSYIFYNNQNDTIFENNSKIPQTYVLSDGSKIVLNSKSRLVQHRDFNKKNRFIELQGEAYFEIEKNKEIPFIIKTNALYTKVVGTKFNINSTKNYINVSVNEGHVKVYVDKDTIDAIPNQRITYNVRNNKLSADLVQSDIYNLWTQEEFILNHISISDLSVVFESVYQHQIIFKDPSIKDKKISISFSRSENIESVLNKINLINEFKLTKKQNNMIEAN